MSTFGTVCPSNQQAHSPAFVVADGPVDRSPPTTTTSIDRRINIAQFCSRCVRVRACMCGGCLIMCVCVIRSVSFASPNHCRTCDARVRVHASNTCWVRCTNTTDDDIETGVSEHARASVFESVCMRVCAGDPVLLCECTRAHIRVWKKCSFTYYYNRTTPRTAMLI